MDRCAAEPAVQETDVLGLTAEELDQAGVETGELESLRKLPGLLRHGGNRCRLQAQVGGRPAVDLGEQVAIEVADGATLVLPDRDAALQAFVLWKLLAGAGRCRA